MARRHESLIPLSREHHDALLLAWRLRTGDLSKREPEQNCCCRIRYVTSIEKWDERAAWPKIKTNSFSQLHLAWSW
jgi:hypothetical protein